MKFRSLDFKQGENIPSEFTCDGKNVPPQLSWEDAPAGTESFAISLTDPDAPGGGFIHWLIYDIPKDVKNIDLTSIPGVAKLVENDFGRKEYEGPCPPSGAHRYIFTIFALDTKNLKDVKKYNFFEKVKEHTLSKSELMGMYRRE
jgi:Raf kinase inhibitor-like YbhB/YbcL family protein